MPHLRQILSGLGVLVLANVVALPRADEAFDEEGKLKDARTGKAVQDLAKALVETAGKLK